jgi:tRNA(fMet)-specific endonuclease VapC
MTVADTDVLIDFLGGVDPGFSRVRSSLEKGQLDTTVITCYELLAGATNPRQEARISDLLRALRVLPLEAAAADSAARIRLTLGRRGEAIGMADCLIAGIVMVQGALLLTRNRRHFERIKELRLADLEGT